MFGEEEEVTRTFDGDRSGVAKGTVEEFQEGRAGCFRLGNKLKGTGMNIQWSHWVT